MEGEDESWYSTSASARAVLHEAHHWMGFLRLYTLPAATNLPNSRMMVAV